MTPHSPGTDQIDTLLQIGFVAAAIVVVAINVALIYALRRNRAKRGIVPSTGSTGVGVSSRRLQFRVGAVLTAFAAAIFILSVVFTGKARETPATGSAGLVAAKSAPLTIKATGQQWLWRYDYPNGAFSYYKLVVPVDTAVELELLSTDVVHTWDVPDLSGKRDAVPGKTNTVIFSADREGEYSGQSATLSGQAYAAMRTAVEVVSPQAYEDFLKQQKADIEAAQDRVVGLIEQGEVP
ncbi:MAG: coxB [Solirubrobacterales bacterium]|nr:coxB [Solirubrobacterales bacterium]